MKRLILISLLLSQQAQADLMKGMYLYAGIEHPDSPSPYCEYRRENHYWTSNLGGGFNLVKTKELEINLHYAHHSCVVARDAISYDAWGLQIRYEIDFK